MLNEELENRHKALEARIVAAEQKQKEYEDERTRMIAGGTPAGNRIDSDEAKCMRAFGVSHVKDLLGVNVGHPNFANVPQYFKHMTLHLKRDFDICRMHQQIFGGQPLESSKSDQNAHVKGILDGSAYGRSVLTPKLKAFGSTVTGAGDEWVPNAVSSSFIEEYELSRQVAQQFKSIQMPTDPFDIPTQSQVTIARIQAESGSLTDANFATGKLTLNATKLTEYMVLPEELNEDSAPAILALVRDEVVKAQGRAVETAILNGDTTGTHMDYDVTSGSDARKAWKGLRKLALANSATVNFSGAALTTAKLRDMRIAAGKFGVNVNELAWMFGPGGYQQAVGLPEVTSVEKFGPMATILKGALLALDGIPVLVSEYVREDVAASGVNTMAGPNTLKVCYLVNLERFYLGIRRPIRVRAVQDPTPPADRWLVASWWRGDFQGMPQSATEKSVVLGINIA